MYFFATIYRKKNWRLLAVAALSGGKVRGSNQDARKDEKKQSRKKKEEESLSLSRRQRQRQEEKNSKQKYLKKGCSTGEISG